MWSLEVSGAAPRAAFPPFEQRIEEAEHLLHHRVLPQVILSWNNDFTLIMQYLILIILNEFCQQDRLVNKYHKFPRVIISRGRTPCLVNFCGTHLEGFHL